MRKKGLRPLWLIVSLLGVLLVLAAPAWGAPVTPQQVVDHVNAAVAELEKNGQAALAPLTDPNNAQWVQGDLYVFIYDLDGNVVAHLNKKLVGKNLLKIKDVKGAVFVADFIRIANSPSGQGWCEYWWPKPSEKEASLKASFIKKVPGQNWLVGVGTYDFTMADAQKATGIQ